MLYLVVGTSGQSLGVTRRCYAPKGSPGAATVFFSVDFIMVHFVIVMRDDSLTEIPRTAQTEVLNHCKSRGRGWLRVYCCYKCTAPKHFPDILDIVLSGLIIRAPY